MDYADYLRASNGDGPAKRGWLSDDREVGDMSVIADTVLNWPNKFIATVGDLNPDGSVTELTSFFGHLEGSVIIIDEFAPGYFDEGNTEGQTIFIKPTSAWADTIAEMIGEGGASVYIGATPPTGAEAGDLWGDTSANPLANVAQQVGAMLMPVGFIYTNKVNATNPGVLLGFGTWEALAGRVVVGVDPSQTEFTPAGKLGGHKLMQAHGHTNRWAVWFPSGTGSLVINDRGGDGLMVTDNAAGGEWMSGNPNSVNNNGGGNAENLQPYVVAYMWERTA